MLQIFNSGIDCLIFDERLKRTMIFNCFIYSRFLSSYRWSKIGAYDLWSEVSVAASQMLEQNAGVDQLAT